MSENTMKISQLFPVNEFTGNEWFEVIQKDGAGMWRSYRLQTSVLKGQKGDVGATGKSAYQFAVENGFTGSVEDWLASLEASDPYQLAVEAGFTGTVEEWLLTLKGDKGDRGYTGASAYEVAVSAGYTGTAEEWLLTLVGPQGEQGVQGPGGKSAYQVAVDNGYTGTETEWLASLQGPDGRSAYEVAVDNGYTGTEAEWVALLQQVGVAEAPVDGQPYARQDGQWVPAAGDGPSLDAGSLPAIPEGVTTRHQGRVFCGPNVTAYLDNDGRLWVVGALGDTFSPIWEVSEWTEPMPGKTFRIIAGCRWESGILAIDMEGYMWGMGGSSYEGSLMLDDADIWPPRKIHPDNDWYYANLSEYDGFYAIKYDGSLWAWGDNGFGMTGLGLDNNTNYWTAQRVGTDNDWRYLETSYWRVAGYKEDGSVYWWGRDINYSGADMLAPEYLDTYPQGSRGSKITWTSDVAFWVKADGTLWYRGTDRQVIAAGATATETTVWTQVGTDTDWDFVSRPGSWSLVMMFKTDGSMYVYGACWDDAGTVYATPTAVNPGVSFVYTHTIYEDALYALADNGDIYAWNENYDGQLGQGDKVATAVPTRIAAEGNFAWMEGDMWRIIAGKVDGTLWKWGEAEQGELLGCPAGTGDILVPVPINSCPVA